MSLLTVNKQYKPSIEVLLIVSTPLTGKTEALLQLPNACCIDLDGTADTFPGNVYSITKLSRSLNKGPITVLKMVMQEILDLKEKGKGFDFVIIDSITALCKRLEPIATQEFKKSDQGSTFSGSNAVLQAGWGNGDKFLDAEFLKLLPELLKLTNKYTILTGHTKYDNIVGADAEFSDIQLSKQIKGSLLYFLNGIGIMYRESKTSRRNILSFETGRGDQALGARPQHLSNKKFLISEKVVDAKGNEELHTYWQQIYPDIPVKYELPQYEFAEEQQTNTPQLKEAVEENM